MNLSLYTVKAVIVLDSEGQRLLAKYYKTSTAEYKTVKDQKAFEKLLHDKLKRSNTEIALLERHVVCYKTMGDVTFYVIGDAEENELLLASVLSAFTESLSQLVKPGLEKRTFQENYDLVILALDETLDDGIVLEVEPNQIVARVSKRGYDSAEMAMAEQTLMQAYQTAKERFTSSLLK